MLNRSVENRHFLNNENGKQLLFEWVRRFGFNYEQAESMFEAMRNEKSGVVFYNDNGQQTTDNSLRLLLLGLSSKIIIVLITILKQRRNL